MKASLGRLDPHRRASVVIWAAGAPRAALLGRQLPVIFAARVAHAGGVPMNARSVTLPRIDTPPVPAGTPRRQPDVPASEPGIGSAALQAKTVAVRFRRRHRVALRTSSRDAAEGLTAVVVQANASAVDQAALTGDGTSKSPVGLGSARAPTPRF